MSGEDYYKSIAHLERIIINSVIICNWLFWITVNGFLIAVGNGVDAFVTIIFYHYLKFP